jgi:hypothetical protein
MPLSNNGRLAGSIHRKLRALTAMLSDPASTGFEKANAEALKARLEKQFGQEAVAEGKWTGTMFRLGQKVKEMTSVPKPKGDWTDHAFRLGRMFRRGFKK